MTIALVYDPLYVSSECLVQYVSCVICLPIGVERCSNGGCLCPYNGIDEHGIWAMQRVSVSICHIMLHITYDLIRL
jgi:hypothetical protein